IESLPLGAHVETFSYSIADGHGDTSTSTLSITVNVTPEAVTAGADTNAVADDSTLTVSAAAGGLRNDTSDGDDALHVTTTGPLTGSLGGTLVMAADGSYTYNPDSIPTIESLPLGAHVETFSYSIADGHGDTSTSTLSITVNVTPEAVTAVADTNAVADDSTLTVSAAAGVLANDTSDGDD